MADKLEPEQLRTYFALMESVSLLQHEVERHLRTEGDLSYVQFQLLARLAGAQRKLTMTELADGVVLSRSGLTHQAYLLGQAGLVERTADPDDHRSTLVEITEAGLSKFAAVLPGHVQVAKDLLFDQLTEDDVKSLGDMMTRVRDHMRARPPRSAATRRRPKPKDHGA